MSISTFYRVTINGISGAAPADGFIDNTNVEKHLVLAAAPGLTLAQCRAKERANLRYDMVVANIGLMANGYVDNFAAPGATAAAAPSSFAFTVEFERGDSVVDTHDEFNAGARITGANALRRCVARALVAQKADNVDVYDPTLTPAPGNATQAMRVGMRIERLTAAALVTGSTPAAAMTAAEAAITVTKIANIN